jgi:hypothetical protein
MTAPIHPPRPYPPHSRMNTVCVTQVDRFSEPKLAHCVQLRETVVSVYDNRDDGSEPTPSPSQPSSFKYVHSIQSHTLPTSTLLTFMCTQVLWCLERLVRISFSGVTMRPDTSLLFFLLTLHSVSETFRSLHFSVYALITPTPIYMYSL